MSEKPRTKLQYDEECNQLRVIVNGYDTYPSLSVRDFDQGNDAGFQNRIYDLIESVWKCAYRTGRNSIRDEIRDVLKEKVII